MIYCMRQMRGTIGLHDLLLIISIALSIPLRLAFPLAAQIVCRRINIYFPNGDQDLGSGSTRQILAPSLDQGSC